MDLLVLCPTCTEIPFDKIFSPSTPGISISHSLGKIVNIRKRATSCSFCWFVLQIHDRTCASFFRQNVQHKARSKGILYLVSDSSWKPWYEVAGVEANRPKAPTAWLQYGIAKDTPVAEPCICISPVSSHVPMKNVEDGPKSPSAQADLGLSYPRWRNSVEASTGWLNYDLIRSWIGICQQRHREECSESIVFKRQLLKVKLIDVHSREVSIVRGDAKYVALSYVRGSSSGRRGNIIPIEVVASLKMSEGSPAPLVLPDVLPKTIEDAITFVKSLGEQYVWIDLFCIDQEDEREKELEIESMDLIYECACLTLIALDGKNFDSGLVGVSRPLQQTYQPIVNTPFGQFMATFVDSIWENHGNAPWDYRAWTFQEGLLSRRSLIFDKRHILMRCWQEIFHDTMEVDLGVDRIMTSQSNLFFWENGWGLDLYQNVWTFSAFDVLIANYSRRELSLQSDALNACKGALSQITRHTGVGFVWGLPHVDIEKALLWRPHQDSCILRREEFPSWSWLGWKGRTEYTYWLTEMDDYDGDTKEPDTKKPKMDYGNSYSTSEALIAKNNKAFVVLKEMNELSHTLKLSTTIARFGLKLVRKQGSTLKNLKPDSLQAKVAVGDHWTLLGHTGTPMRNMAGEYFKFEEIDHFFHLHTQVSRLLAVAGNKGEFVFIRFWREIRDHHGSKNWLTNMVSALLIIRNPDRSAWRVASVVMKLEDWAAANPQPAVVLLT